MTEITAVFLNFILWATFLTVHIKKEKHTKTISQKITKSPKSQKEISDDEKRNFEILDQIQRYDGTKFLRKE